MIRKKNLQEKGITLIALVVTIIILLILAGVTLNMALSQNGLFSKTKEATEKYKQAQEDEEIEVEKIEYAVDGKDIKEVQKISSKEEFANFREEVNKGEKIFENTLVKLYCDLDLSGETWTPIGTVEHPFNGVFNGNGHKINNLSLGEVSDDYKKVNNKKFVGLFGFNEGIIENIGIESGSIGTSSATCGSIAGFSSGIINNCYNKAKFNNALDNENCYAGGIVWDLEGKGEIVRCYNEGELKCKISAENCGCSGIVGWGGQESVIENSFNKGNIELESSGKTPRAGGIACGECDVVSCYNTGNIEVRESDNETIVLVGGIYSRGMNIKAIIKDCYNIGYLKVEGVQDENKFIGGIIGQGKCSVKNCFFLENCQRGAWWEDAVEKMEFTVFSEDGKDSLVEKLGESFTMDRNYINAGYPILKWQVGE